ncbi:restriction endonuclease subunit S [Kaistella sp. BT6-1-3]|uniref:Restriction endonuclease subunit S n=1 Tax=Kaistella yananensis TaxID=2989820 RepID=A0ABT3JLD7_9FLAO|nr:restriction endonuclease subunit S [Kaistella yananensis]MCW4451591.1 restriction endonuclease subunit S [Kaistella yananensis]
MNYTIGELFKIRKGKKAEEKADGSFNYITIENLHSRRYNHRTSSNGVFVQKEDILIAWDGANAGLVGTSLEGIIGSTLAQLKLEEHFKDTVDTYYVYRYLDSNFELIKSKRTGATIPHVNGVDLKAMIIPLPPLSTQKAIAEKLDKADALRKKDKELLAQYDDLAQSIFIDMFGDPTLNEKGWQKLKLEKLMKIRRGASPRPIEKFIGDDVSWIKIGDATDGDNIYLNSTKVRITEEGAKKSVFLKKGSMVFANCGVSLGFCRILNIEGCIHDGWLSFEEIDENVINKFYLLKGINFLTDYFRRTAPDGTQPNLNTSIMKNFEIAVPPMELQNHFVEITHNIETQKSIVKQQAQQSEDLFQALLQESFNF